MIISLDNVNEALISELKDFYRCYYSEKNRFFTDGYLSWLLLKNPHGEGISVNIRLDCNIVANMFLIPVKLIKKGESKLAYYVVDVLSHPNHRDKNLFVKMIRRAIEMTKEKGLCLIGHPNSNALPGWKRAKMSFQPNFVSYMSRPGICWKKKIVSSSKQISKKDRMDLSLLIENNRTLIINADADFIIWKYINCPSKKYKVELLYKGSNIIGVIVSYKVQRIVDRVVHYMYDDKYTREVICSSVIPKIYSFPATSNLYGTYKLFFKHPLGTSVNYFFTDYSPDADNGSGITYAACDN